MRTHLTFAILILALLLSACIPVTGPSASTPTRVPTGESEPQASPTQPEAAGVQPAGSSSDLPTSATLPPQADPATSTPEPTPVFGAGLSIPDYPVAGVELEKGTTQGPVVREYGAYWARRNGLLWSSVERQKGGRNWEAIDPFLQDIAAVTQAGLEPLLVVRSTPIWAQQRAWTFCGPVKSEELEAFGAFMYDLVTLMSAPPYNVRFFEIGNEPDVDPVLVPRDSQYGCWGDPEDPYYGGGYYADMLKVVYPQVKAANPDAQVVIGGLLLDCDPLNPPMTSNGQPKDCSSALFLEGILKNGGGDYFDVVSFHAYDYYGLSLGLYGNENWHSTSFTTGPSLIAKARYIKQLLATYGVEGKRLINTENALLCVSGMGYCQDEKFKLSKAYYLAQANAAALTEGLSANVWYSAFGWRESQLMDRQLEPVEALLALQVSSQVLDGAAFSKELVEFDGLMGYEFARQGARLWMVWSLDGEPHPLELPTPPDRVLDVFGEAVAAAGTLQVGPTPLYIEWNP